MDKCNLFLRTNVLLTDVLPILIQWNLPKADILQSGLLSKTDKKFCPGQIPKESLITKPLQSGHSKADTFSSPA